MKDFTCPRCGAVVPEVTVAELAAADTLARLRYGRSWRRDTVYVCADCADRVGEQATLPLEVAS